MLSRSLFPKLYTLGFAGLLSSSNVYSDIDENYSLSVGANLANYNSELAINSQDKSIDKAFGFEDDLGYDKKVNAGWVSGWYRTGEHHRLRLTYTPIKRSSFIQNDKDIVVDNTTIKAGAALSSKSRTEILDFSYIYSIHKTAKLEAGLSAGIYWLLSDTKIFAVGEIQAEGDNQSSFRSDFFTEEKILAPMPLIGISANYEISNSWRTHASLRYLSLQVDEIDGNILSAEAGTEYYFNDNWGIGASLAYFDLDIEVNGIISNSSLSWDHSGIQLYAVFKY